MKVPKYPVDKELSIPAIGFGTFGSDHISNEEIMDSVRIAIKKGYRHIDCASVYGNEKEIGLVLKEAMSGALTGEKIPREEFWITGKLWNDRHSKDDVIPSFKKTLDDLGLDYLDLYLIHWPFPNFHPPKCDISSRAKNAKPYIHEEFMVTWKELEKINKQGLAKFIGLSNVSKAKLQLILRDCEIKPSFVEMELHPHFQQKELVSYAKSQGLKIIGFCPLGSPNRPERDKSEEDTVDLTDPVVKEIAKAHGVHPAEICLKWAKSNEIIPIPLSTKESHIESNLRSVVENDLTIDEIEKLNTIDKNSRLIKGHVFLWEGAKSWHSLWDEDGIIEK